MPRCYRSLGASDGLEANRKLKLTSASVPVLVKEVLGGIRLPLGVVIACTSELRSSYVLLFFPPSGLLAAHGSVGYRFLRSVTPTASQGIRDTRK